MYLQEILEVAIGLVFVWLVISVATMSLNEWIGSIVNLRANELEKLITQMLNDKDLANKFYQHPMIANLYGHPLMGPKPAQNAQPDTRANAPAQKPDAKPRYPSYIPAQKFGATLFELVIQAGTEQSPVHLAIGDINNQLALIQSPEHQKLAGEDWTAILETAKDIAASGLGSTAVDSLKVQMQVYGEKYPETRSTVDALLPQVDTYYKQFVQDQQAAVAAGIDSGLNMRQFRLGMLALQKANPHLGASVASMIQQAEGYALQADQTVAAVRVNIETWFNDAMERLSGTHKRTTMVWSFVIGVILALVMNVDSINVATAMWREPTLRQVILNEAQNYKPPTASQAGNTGSAAISDPLANISTMKAQLQNLSIPFGWEFTPLKSFDAKADQCSIIPVKFSKDASTLIWGIPGTEEGTGDPTCLHVSNLPGDLVGWLEKILGLLITGAAAMQGAPFWFDMLGKLVNVRSSGSNPSEKTAVG